MQDARSGELVFVPPHQAWHATDGAVPPFLPNLPRSLRRLLADPSALHRLRDLGLRIWEAPEHSPAAVRDLSSALSANAVADDQNVAFKRHYAAAWTQVAHQEQWPWADEEQVCLAVERGPALTTITASHKQAVYVVDEEAELKESLVALAGHPVLVTEPAAGAKVAELLEEHGLLVTRLSKTDMTILDGENQITASTDHPLLTHGRPWLPLVALLVAELRPDPHARRRERRAHAVVDRLRSIRLARADEVDILVDGARPRPSHALHALPLPDEQHPTIVVCGDIGGWQEMQVCAPALAHLLGRPALRDALELTFLKLQRSLDEQHGDAIDDATLALALDTTEERVGELRRSFTGGLPDLVQLIGPVLVYDAGVQSVASIEDSLVSVGTEDELHQTIEHWANAQSRTTTTLVDLARQCRTPADLRDALDLDFGRFNEALTALGAPYAPTVHLEIHDHVFNEFLTDNAHAIIDRLREHFQPLATQGIDISSYILLRQFDGLVPDPAWLPAFRTPPRDAILKRTQSWLRSLGADGDLELPSSLDPLEAMRASNMAVLESTVELLASLVNAWCRTHNTDVPAVWASAPLSNAREALDRSGLADLLDLAPKQVLDLLADTPGWPAGMERTLSKENLGLQEVDLQLQQSAAPTSTGNRRDNSTIIIGDTVVKVGASYLADIVTAARESIDEDFLSLKGNVRLDQAPAIRPARSPDGRTGGFAVIRSLGRLSEDQRSAVGLTGEVIARGWLVGDGRGFVQRGSDRSHSALGRPGRSISGYRELDPSPTTGGGRTAPQGSCDKAVRS